MSQPGDGAFGFLCPTFVTTVDECNGGHMITTYAGKDTNRIYATPDGDSTIETACNSLRAAMKAQGYK